MQLEQEIAIPQAPLAPAGPRRTKIIRPPSLSPAAVFGGLTELFQYRDLLLTLTIHRIKVRYKQSALGLSWAILQPLSLMIVYTIIFSIFTRVPAQGPAYNLFVLAGLLPWLFFQTALSSAATGLVSHTQLVTKVYFPREIIPITYVFAAVFDFVLACMLLGMMMAWYHVSPHREVLFVIPILAVAFAFATGLALLFSAIQVRFRDIGIAMPLILQLWMFGSPVVYSFSQVPERFRSFYILNPEVGIVENFRRVVILGIGPDLHLFAISAVVSIVALIVGYFFFRYREATMADII